MTPRTLHRMGPGKGQASLLLLLATLLATPLTLAAAGCNRKGAKAFNHGQGHLKKKQYRKAIYSFEKATKQNPDFGEAYYNLGAARFQLAAKKLNTAVQKHKSPALVSALKAAEDKAATDKTLAPDRETRLATLKKELDLLPAVSTAPIVTLLRDALAAKLKARALFKKGKFVVIRKSSTRQAMIKKLDQVVQLRTLLRKRGEQDRGLWLAAVARPKLLTDLPQNKSRPRPTGAKTP